MLHDAVGQRAQRGARAAFAVGERFVERRVDDLDAVALDELQEAPLADVVARDLRAQVAGARFGRARVRAQQVDRLVDDAVAAHERHRRDHGAFGEEVARVGRHRAGHGAADVGVVRFVRRIAHEPVARGRSRGSP